MFSRLTLDTLLTSEGGMSKVRNMVANLPLNGASKTSRELAIGESITLEFRANQHGMAYLIMASEKLSVSVIKKEALADTGFPILKSEGAYHALHRKRSLDERLNLDDRFYIIIENTSPFVAKIAAIHT